MKKLIGIGIAAMMVVGLAGSANAYILGASAKDSAGMNGMTNLQFGDAAASTAAQPAGTTGTVELALPSNQAWRPNDGTTPIWYYKDLIKPAPLNNQWVIAIWGNSFAQSTATVTFSVSSLGGAANTGTTLPTGPWTLTNLKTNEVVWTGNAASATGTWFTVSLPVINTTTPQIDAAVYALAPAVPEPGSILALASGLAGLAGFAIRRRK